MNKKFRGLPVRFFIRMVWATLALSIGTLLLATSYGPDYLAFIAGGIGALLLAHALRLFGAIGGRTLIVATLVILLGTLLVPLNLSFIRSVKDFQVFLYLVSAIADACGLLLVYRSGGAEATTLAIQPSEEKAFPASTPQPNLLRTQVLPHSIRDN